MKTFGLLACENWFFKKNLLRTTGGGLAQKSIRESQMSKWFWVAPNVLYPKWYISRTCTLVKYSTSEYPHMSSDFKVSESKNSCIYTVCTLSILCRQVYKGWLQRAFSYLKLCKKNVRIMIRKMQREAHESVGFKFPIWDLIGFWATTFQM